ncbi:hypothetical protein BsWGS_20465 [Bradybaena similaris]
MNNSIPELSKEAYSGLVSFQTRYIIHLTFFVILSGVVSLLGMLANVINILVFVRQGFRDSMNISLLGLAVADFMCLLTMFWISFTDSPLFECWKFDFHESDLTYMTGAWPRIYFVRINSFITAFITLERCLCIALPHKVKTIISPLTTKVAVSTIFASMLVFVIPFYCVNRLAWRYNQLQNRTLLTIVYTQDKVAVETAVFPIYGVFLPLVTLLTVIVCSIILVVQLNKTTEWRNRSMTSSKFTLDVPTTKEKKVMKMVTLIATIFIVCYLPAAVNFVAMTCAPEFSFTGRFVNLFFIAWSVTMFLETVCSSVNILVYYNMSSKFKTTFKQVIFRSLEDA